MTQPLRKSAAEDSSTILNTAISPIPTDTRVRELEAENQTLRALLRDLRIPETKDLNGLRIQNEVMAAVVDGVLFKERMTEIVREVLFTELDDYLDLRFSKGAVYRDEAIEEVRARLQQLSTNKPEYNHGR